MTDNRDKTQGKPERIGNVLSIVFLLALAALFLYGYAQRILATI
jgi:hypothetical protein